MNKFPQRLKELRMAKKVTQEELGQHLGFRDSTISQYESGSREPDYDTLLKIAEFFGVTTDYLLGRSVVCEPSSSYPTIAAHCTDNILERNDVPEEAKETVKEFIEFVKQKYGIQD